MDEEQDEGVFSFLRGQEGWNEKYSSISEFKQHLNQSDLVDKELECGWVLWRENEQQLNNTTHLQHKITTLFEHLLLSFGWSYFFMAQFWGVVKVEGRRHYLSTSHHPFSVSDLQKGYCWYRKQCMDHVYPVGMDGTVEEAQLGGVGRAYRNKHPESTPDLRLYSTNEFPLRDHAARCGFRFYLALPLFHLHTNECCGVLELLSDRAGINGFLISSLTEQLQIAGLRSTHINFNPIAHFKDIMERIEEFMKKMAIQSGRGRYRIVQFWAPKMAEGRCYLETSAQPYALGCLAKGLASFRKECMKHHYFVDDEAKEEELGPPGRVFRNKQPEITPDLLLYSTKEFSMKNYAMHCCLEKYFVLPVFDERKHKCAGVLEFIGFGYSNFEDIETALKAAQLRSTGHIHFQPRFIPTTWDTINYSKKAFNEVQNAFSVMTKIPHLHNAKMWVPYEKCVSISTNESCMTDHHRSLLEDLHTYEVHWIHVQSRKGIIGMALESESKSCFCRDLSEFSIIDQPLAIVYRREKIDVCFAICLQSSHTGDLTYVLEFFLKPSPQYVESFFKFLLPIMKQKLKSFKYACGKQLGEELVVDVIQFSEANNLAFPELGQRDDVPIKFRSVQYCQMEHQQAEEPVQYVSDGMQTEQCRAAAASVSKKTEKGKRKTGFHLSLQDLEPHFGKKLKDVAEELGVGRSTIKRACRYHSIGRWPWNENQTRKPSIYEKEKEQDSQQDVQPSSSGNLRQLDVSLHQTGPRTNTESLIVQEEVEKVMMIKVRSDEDIIKFELCLSLGVGKLLEEVATRLNLKMGTFKLKYLDEDNDEILVTCDADWQLCLKSQKTVGKTCIELFLR